MSYIFDVIIIYSFCWNRFLFLAKTLVQPLSLHLTFSGLTFHQTKKCYSLNMSRYFLLQSKKSVHLSNLSGCAGIPRNQQKPSLFAIELSDGFLSSSASNIKIYQSMTTERADVFICVRLRIYSISEY